MYCSSVVTLYIVGATERHPEFKTAFPSKKSIIKREEKSILLFQQIFPLPLIQLFSNCERKKRGARNKFFMIAKNYGKMHTVGGKISPGV